jgi:uncharacterized membrane protein YeaQ/YmgE (transglycosylase-associated protein family)
MGIISSIIVGLIVGAVAKLLMPGRDPSGWLITIILGIVGSTVGSFLGQRLGFYRPEQPAGFIMSVVGAMLLLGIYRFFTKHKQT